MRICIVTPAKIALTETFIRAHVENLPQDRVCIYGYWLDYCWKDRKLREWYDESHLERGKWLNLLPRFAEFRLRRRFFPKISDLEIARDFLTSQHIDVVLAEYGTAAAFITPVCRAEGIPLVAHFHGFDASCHQTLEDFAESYRLMFDYASSVISVSHAMSQRLIGLGCPSEKICYNPYGPDPRFFDIRPNYSSRTLIAVGRHTAKKAPYLTLDAFRLALRTCPELRLCMLGGGNLFEVADRLVHAWGLTAQVELAGPAEPAEIRNRMSQAFAFIQHSVQARDGDSEGTPVAILEAGAAGLPVVSTRHAGIPEAVIDGETGFVVEPGDTCAMSQAIVSLAEDQNLVEQMGAAMRNHIKNNYSMQRHIFQLNQVIESAAVC